MNARQLSSVHHSSFITRHCLVLAEIALVFAVFFIQGASPVPGVNEPYYLGKAIRYWNPDWARGDFFLNSKDSHTVFYYTFGWLSLWLRPTALAWFGRVLTWGLLAWAWQRLSFAVLRRRWCSILTAALMVGLIERCHMAGEWVVGGVEAKGFAFVLVFLGLEAVVRNRWNRAWLFLGAASAFHVLVGGWSVVAVGLAWLMVGKDRPPLRSMWPALLGGFLLSLFGLIFALRLNWGTEAEIVREANQIYVFKRLAHHLAPWLIRGCWGYILRFGLLTLLWLGWCRVTRPEGAARRMRAFVAAAVLIALAGFVIGAATHHDRALAAGLLRFYWFRLADVAVPMGVALEAVALALRTVQSRPMLGRGLLAAAILAAGVHVGVHLLSLPLPTESVPWRRACGWVSRSGQIPPDARFIVPEGARTFKWYAGRAEVANWKEIPQDAVAIVEWWQRIDDLYIAGRRKPAEESLGDLGAERLNELGRKYEADYVITVAEPRLDLPVLYENRGYAIYRLDNR